MKRFVLATLFVVLAAVLPAVPAIAQNAAANPQAGVVSGLNSINSTLSALIATVNSLGSKIAQLTNTIGTPPPSPTVLIIGPVTSIDNTPLLCSVVNTGSANAMVTITARDGDGNVLNVPTGSPFTVAPGTAAATGVGIGSGGALVYCRFDSAQAAQLSATLELGSVLALQPK